MLAFLRLVSILARYGSRFVSWAWAHRDFVIWLISQLGVGAAIEWILRHV